MCGHGGSLWGETRVREGLHLGLAPLPHLLPAILTRERAGEGPREFSFSACTEQRGLWGGGSLQARITGGRDRGIY